MTLRSRLVVAAIVITLTVIAALGYIAIRQREVLTAQLDDQLATVAANIGRADRNFEIGSGPLAEREGLASTGGDDQQSAADGGGFPSTGELYFAIVEPDGNDQVIARPLSHPDLVPDITVTELEERAVTSEPFTVDVTGAVGAARAVAVGVGEDRFAIVAVSTSAVDDAQDQLLTTAAIALAVILLTMAVVLWSMDRLGIRPITAVTKAAEDVAAGRSDRRVTHPPMSTEAGRLGDAFNTMLDARQATEAQQRRFVADASHELRTPLTTLRGYTALHAGGALSDEEINDAMGRINSEAKRMDSLVDDLLTLASLDDDRPLDLRPLDLSQLLHDMAADAKAVQPTRPVETAHISDGLILDADRHQLTQALTTVITNALRHTPSTSQLTLTGQRCGTRIRVRVEDQGPGIAPEHLDRLFERFYRIDPGRTRQTGGSGLGLSIAKAIVEAHHGTIAADSTIGIGTAITINLPAGQPA